MIIKDKWKSTNENETEENKFLKELSNLWSSQMSVTITNSSIITKGPVKYSIISKQ